MRNLLSMEHLTNDQVMKIIERAAQFEAGEQSVLNPPRVDHEAFFINSARFLQGGRDNEKFTFNGTFNK